MLPLIAGFDGHKFDQVGGAFGGLTEEDFRFFTSRLVRVAERVCEGRIVSVLEGGYNVEGGVTSAFAVSVREHVRGLQRTAAGVAEPEKMYYFPKPSLQEKKAVAKLHFLLAHNAISNLGVSAGVDSWESDSSLEKNEAKNLPGPAGRNAHAAGGSDGSVGEWGRWEREKDGRSECMGLSSEKEEEEEERGRQERYGDTGKRRKEGGDGEDIEKEEAYKRRRECETEAENIDTDSERCSKVLQHSWIPLKPDYTLENTGPETESGRIELVKKEMEAAVVHPRLRRERPGGEGNLNSRLHCAQETWRSDVEVGEDALSDVTASDAEECWALLTEGE